MRRLAVATAFIVLAACVLAISLGDFVRLRDNDARPALGAGEIAFVRTASVVAVEDLPERGALLAVRDGAGVARLGRIVGYPGEELSIAAGELLQGAAPLVVPFDQQAWVPWSDTARESTPTEWLELEAWRRDATGWSGDFQSPALRLVALDDGWLRDDGTRSPGQSCAPALRVALSVHWSRPQGQLQVELRDGGAVVQFIVERDGSKVSNAVQLLDAAGSTVQRGLAYADMRELPADAFEQEWIFEARAGWAQVRVDGQHYMSTPFPRGGDAPPDEPRALVRFGAGGATLARLAVWRAPAWRDEAPALRVAPGHCLVLADDPMAAARWDSCHQSWDRILGCPVAVVWPPSAWRRLP